MDLVAFEGRLASSIPKNITETAIRSYVWPKDKQIWDLQKEIIYKARLLDEYFVSDTDDSDIVYVWNYITDIILSAAQNQWSLQDLVEIVQPGHIWWPQVICLHPEDVIYSLIIVEMFPESEIVFISDYAEINNNLIFQEVV